MKLDATHRRWLIVTVVIAALSTTAYVAYAVSAPDGPKGGSWLGLTFGVAGAAMILFAGLLGVRRKMLRVRIGSLTCWMRGHLWLGLLSLLMVLLHGAFHFGGPLTSTLMVLLLAVVISGIAGAALQHVLPGVMTSQVTDEHTYEQLQRVRMGLRRDAWELIASVCGSVEEAADEGSEIEALTGSAPKAPKKVDPANGHEHFKALYLSTVLPFLRDGGSGRSPLSDETKAAMLFEYLRPRIDESLHDSLDALAGLCDSSRQQDRQRRLHRLLHGWLLFHVPVSMALIVLTVVHAIMGLYY